MSAEEAVVQNQQAVPQPPPLISRWIRCVLGLTVGVGVGLAPYLGKYNIPLFDSLLKLIPTSIQDTLLIFSATLMGIVAVVIQFYDYKKLRPKWLEKMFKRTLFVTGISFILLVIIHSFIVVKVPYLGGKASQTFLVGFTKPGKPPCTLEMSKARCIQHITLDVAKVEAYWGDMQILVAKLLLFLVYLTFTGSFALLVGLLLLINPDLEIQPEGPEHGTPHTTP